MLKPKSLVTSFLKTQEMSPKVWGFTSRDCHCTAVEKQCPLSLYSLGAP